MGSDGGKRAYAVLLTSNSYTIGVRVLQWSLRSVDSNYPLVVLYTETLTEESVQILERAGCIMKKVERIGCGTGDDAKLHLAQPYYNDMFTKFHVFNLTEFSQIVCLDADMLVRKNLDELMTLNLPDKNWLAACPGCRCNPMKVPTYPEDWVPENCCYNKYRRESDRAGLELPSPADLTNYFNAGMIVLKPSEKVFLKLTSQLPNLDASKYAFAEQDFLNETFAGKWIRLSYAYNALKTLRSVHSEMWEDSEIRIVHYILEKPWADLHWSKLSEDDKNTRAGPFYEVNSWWFEAYEAMIKSEKL